LRKRMKWQRKDNGTIVSLLYGVDLYIEGFVYMIRLFGSPSEGFHFR
jgi:hypothetical protein